LRFSEPPEILDVSYYLDGRIASAEVSPLLVAEVHTIDGNCEERRDLDRKRALVIKTRPQKIKGQVVERAGTARG
jgi:hypothetical protein